MQHDVRLLLSASFSLVLACGSLEPTTDAPELGRVTLALTAAQPDDPYFADQWQLHGGGPFTTQDGKGQIEGGDHAHVAEAWGLIIALGLADSVSDIGTNVRLAIIDDGFDLAHEELAGKIVASKNFGGPVESSNLFSNGSPADFHGMLVTGIAAASADNGKGLAGACPGCRVVLARMAADPSSQGKSSEDYYDEIFDWVLAQKADVVNASWGPDAGSDEARLTALIERARNTGRGGKGTALVFAAGNTGEDFAWNTFATSDATISVGGSDSSGLRYDFSNFGVGLDVLAPTSGGEKRSSGLGSTYIDRIWTTDNHVDPTCLKSGQKPSSGCSDTAGWTPTRNMAGGDGWEGRYSYRFSHTSAAAPLVSGIVGLLLHTNPMLTSDELRAILVTTADKVSQSDASYDDTGFSTKYGYGRVNALRAVAFAHLYGGGTISDEVRAQIDALSPCTRSDCWDLSGAPPVPPRHEDAGTSGPGTDADAGAMQHDPGMGTEPPPSAGADDDAGADGTGTSSSGDGAQPGTASVRESKSGCSIAPSPRTDELVTSLVSLIFLGLARRRAGRTRKSPSQK